MISARWPSRLWIVRHGESAGNVARDAAHAAGAERIELLHRDVDIPLSPLGEDQARALGTWFASAVPDDRPDILLVYPEGNYIRASDDRPFLQIGETKYGKPIIDRAVRWNTELYDALKIGLISFDSTMRSNLAVGLPIDLMVLRRDALDAETRQRIDQDDPYFHALGEQWSSALREAHMAIPAPPYRLVS